MTEGSGAVSLGWVERDSNAATAVICLPPAAGNAAPFARWRPLVQTRGLALAVVDWGEAASVRERARAVAAVVRAQDRPVVLLGHSFGGLVAFEAACDLHSDDRLRLLVLCAVAPPHRRPVEDLTDADDAALLARRDRLAGGSVPSHPLLDGLFLARMRRDIRAAQGYRHRPGRAPRCPVSVHHGHDDAVVDAEEMASWAGIIPAVRLRGWPGGHHFLHETPAAVLDSVLADVGASPGGVRS